MDENVRLSQDLGFVRVGAAVPPLRIADVDFNVANIVKSVKEASARGVQVLVFPEMALTGYTIADLVLQQALLSKVKDGIKELLQKTARTPMLIIVGAPLEIEQKVFNCAVILGSGQIHGIVPKTFLPTYKEFYEGRWFAPSWEAQYDTMEFLGQEVHFGTDLLFNLKGIPSAVVGVEICEDLWVPFSPHEYQAAAGATLLMNLSASDEILGKADWRRTMIVSESGRCAAAYCYVSSGIGESSNDVVYGGHTLVAENGTVLREADRLTSNPAMLVCDVDVERLAYDRRMTSSFRNATTFTDEFRIIDVQVSDPFARSLERNLDPHPFVPSDPTRRAERCKEIFSMQVAALAQKLLGSKLGRLVVGISGGVDSTLALLAAVKTMDFLKLPRTNVHAFSLPGFGTTQRTKQNAARLCSALGVTFEVMDISKSCRSILKDLKHDGQEDVVFENVQARYRTEFLFNKANQIGAMLLGTGDLTEVALGWCTFSGDHLSHYHVNISVPKTLVRYLISWVADEESSDSVARKALYDILDTPISPELRRPNNGQIAQMSEEVIGPVELADFYLYPFIRFGTRPGKILFLANEVRKRGLFQGKYTLDDLHKWLKSFIQRFFANQFKRTCYPEGPKVGSVSLSPRGDWRMPSDAVAKLWLDDLEAMHARLSK